jgi:hypothetical protein
MDPLDQQLPIFGQLADSHTVFNPCFWIKSFNRKYLSPFGRGALSQSGSLLDKIGKGLV